MDDKLSWDLTSSKQESIGVMARRLLHSLTHPYSTFFNLITHPQLLTEHSSGWLAILLGWSLMHRSRNDELLAVLSAVVPAQVWAAGMIATGVAQLVSVVVMVSPHKGFATLAAFILWLFMTILMFFGDNTPRLAIVFPIFTISCALSYLSLSKDSTHTQ